MVKQELVNTTPPPPPTDGFDSPDNDTGGGASFVKFDGGTQSLWFYRDGTPLRLKPWIAVECRKEAVRWQDKRIIDRIESEEPDIDALNKKIPQDEWEEGFDGEPKPPWQMQHTIFFVNPEDGSKIISSNSTWGQKAAYGDLKDRVKFMRSYRGEHVVPVVELASKLMRTRFGTRSRPHFEITGWKNFGPPSVPAIAVPVTPLTAGEIIIDEIPDHPRPKNVPWNDSIPDNL